MYDNRYLRDRAYRRNMRNGRNAYGSRGGYVSSKRGMRRDRAMDMEYDYPKYDSGYYSEHDYPRGHQDYPYSHEQHREHHRPMEYPMYDYRMRDMGYDYAHEDMEKEWKEHLEKWHKELKRYDRFNMPKEQIIQSARQMGVSFKHYTEEEFLTAYYMVMSDYPQVANEPHTYLAMAKDWLEDKDSKLQGGEKLCAYYYEVIKGGEED